MIGRRHEGATRTLACKPCGSRMTVAACRRPDAGFGRRGIEAEELRHPGRWSSCAENLCCLQVTHFSCSDTRRIVSDNPTVRVDRDEVERALCGFDEALPRIMAGGESKPIYQIRRLSDLADPLNRLREKTGHGLSLIELEQLRFPSADYVSTANERGHREWLREHGYDEVVRDAASRSSQGPR